VDIRKVLRGTGVALVTPFKNEKIDFDALERIIEHVLAGGVEFVVSLGTTGESGVLSLTEQREIVTFTSKIVRERVPIVAGIFGGNDTQAIAERLKSFDFTGIDALLCSSPAYSKPSQEGIFQHFMRLAEASPLPIILYNVPSRTASNLTAETTLRLAHASEKFIGVKEASNDLYQILSIAHDRPTGFLVFAGDDFFALPIIACGGDGVISVIANTTPRLFSDLTRAALAGDLATAKRLNFKLLDLYRLLFIEGNPVGVKAALNLQKICSAEVRLPLTPMSDSGLAQLKTALDMVLKL
jgi:4-hydroxy-tetrahydrodipicolinate synthase